MLAKFKSTLGMAISQNKDEIGIDANKTSKRLGVFLARMLLREWGFVRLNVNI